MSETKTLIAAFLMVLHSYKLGGNSCLMADICLYQVAENSQRSDR